MWSEANLEQNIISSILHDFMYVEKSEKLCVHMPQVEGRFFYKFWLSIKES
jgi:hypothetical protein